MKKIDEGIVRVAQFDDSQGLLMKDAITTAGQRKLRLLSNLELDKRLVGSDQWKSEREMYPCWSGTLIAYEEPGKAFGKTIAFKDLVLNVPKAFQGKVNCAIVCNHPDFILKDNEITLGKSARIISFPGSDGWYLPDKFFGIPNGDKSSSSESEARYVWRRTECFVSLVARGCAFLDGTRGVSAYYYYYYLRLGVFGSSVGAKKNVHCKHRWVRVCKICGAERRTR